MGPPTLTEWRRHPKRVDLQGIRGIAILYVLLMHLRPQTFRLGFIGVDMFFVLSGFLMTKILREKEFTTCSVWNFYVRRFRRIVPLYLLIVVATYIYGYFYLIYPDRKQLLEDLRWVCTFSSNMQPLFQKLGYWDQLSEYRFFVHTWSLGVELQYYLLVPLLTGSTMNCGKRSRLVIFILLMITSMMFQLLTIPAVSYGFLFSRVWQFMCGSIVYEFSEPRSRLENGKSYKPLSSQNDESQEIEQNDSAYNMESTSNVAFATMFFFSLTALVIISPAQVTDHLARISSTFIAAIIIYLDTGAFCITNKPVVYCGDISYVLYLVHWPVIVATRYYCDTQQLSYLAVMLAVSLSLFISIAAHHSVESFFISNGVLPAFICVIGCYIYLCGTARAYAIEPSLNSGLSNSSKEYAIAVNILESKKVYYQQPCKADSDTPLYTNYNEEPPLRCVAEGNGTANILLIGNSIAYRAYTLIHDILAGRYRTFRLYSRSSCPPLSNWCPSFTKATRKVVQHEKPDILINIHHSLHKPIVAPIENFKTDPVFNQFQSNVDFFSNYSKHIVIDMPYYKFPNMIIGAVLAKRMEQGLPPGDDLVVTWEQYMNQTRYHRQRISSIVCNKCIIHDVAKDLFHDGVFYTYDPKTLLARLGDGSHLTPTGLELLRSSYTEILELLLTVLPN
ncbi:hypothetical protein V3C99_011231 [Haemonchus contortus]